MPKITTHKLIFMGIDPGKAGGIAVINNARNSVAVKMPDTCVGILDAMEKLCGKNHVVCCLEKVHAMPGQGVSSMFTFGEGFGYLKMALAAKGISTTLVTPQAWQKHLGVKRRDKAGGESSAHFKKRLRQIASGLFPQNSVTAETADALMLAEYCRSTHNA